MLAILAIDYPLLIILSDKKSLIYQAFEVSLARFTVEKRMIFGDNEVIFECALKLPPID